MSFWKSFFHQLSKPTINNSTIPITEVVCQCDKGVLLLKGKSSYHPQGECLLHAACCVIQIDKHLIDIIDQSVAWLEELENSFEKRGIIH
ncbi:MAG: hypothetical protein ACXADY_02970 [Candidatus Hodarchaeales archaeon]|jgi:hypothetical protein